MAQTRVYSLEAFIDDVRRAFSSTKDPRSQAQAIAKHLTELLTAPDWAEEKLRKQAQEGGGAQDLYLDEKLGHPGPDTTPGFKVMCSLSQGTVPYPLDERAGYVELYIGLEKRVSYIPECLVDVALIQTSLSLQLQPGISKTTGEGLEHRLVLFVGGR